VLEADELTILTGWAQALAEALVYAPERVEIMLANAQADAPWRAALQIAELSPQLSKAICFMRQAARAVMSQEDMPTLDAWQSSCAEHLPEDDRLEMLVHRVMQSMLEQLRARKPTEGR